MTNPVKLTIPSDSCYLILIRSLLRCFLSCLKLPEDLIYKLISTVDEACSNIIKHSYEGRKDKTIDLSFSCVSNRFIVKIRDYGKPCEKCMVRPRALDDIRPGGLGSRLMFEVMDSVDFDTKFEKGTLLTMKKKLDVPVSSGKMEDCEVGCNER